ncbi:MAG: photosynthetic complex putative assembly protein PuhB [Pseudomonadota bacterium]
MRDDHFQPEPIRGLPQALPPGEKILWQGAPNWWGLARDALLIRWIIGYFGLLAIWRAVIRMGETGWIGAAQHTLPLILAGVIAVGLMAAIAWSQARATVYTITNRRLVMRIGVALTLAINLPFSRVGAVDLQVRRDGTGTIALRLTGGKVPGYLACWPHVRPWRMAQVQPALRSIPDAAGVATLLSKALRAELSVDQTMDALPAVAAE